MMQRARELRGRNGQIFGSADYLTELNKKHVVGKAWTNYSAYQYEEMLHALSVRLRDAVREILEDCKKNARYLSFVDRSERKKLYDFVNGLDIFSSLARNRISECRDCLDYLEIKESDTKRKTSASERELDTAVGKIYSGYKYSMNLSDRKELIRKAAEDGLSWAARGDIEKAAFITEVMAGKEKDFLKDVMARYEYIHDIRKELDGKCGYDMFSERYIKHYEEKIFGIELQGKHISDGTNNYSEFWVSMLKKIAEEIKNDLTARGRRDYRRIKYDNIKRIETCLNGLDKYGVYVDDIRKNMKKYDLTDISTEFKRILSGAKTIGHNMIRKYPKAIITVQEAAKYYVDGEEIPEDVLYDTANLYYMFIERVKSGATYDLKYSKYNKEMQYILDDMIIDYDDTGNIAYGVLAKAIGMDDLISHGGGGLYNAWSNINPFGFLKKTAKALIGKNDNYKEDIEELIDSLIQEISWLNTFFDDPRDYAAIELGFEYYKKV